MWLQAMKAVLAIGGVVSVLAYAVYVGVCMLQGYEPPALLSAYSQSSIWVMISSVVVCSVLILAIIVLGLCSKRQASDDDDEPWGTVVHDFTGLGGPMMPHVPDYAEQARPRAAQVD